MTASSNPKQPIRPILKASLGFLTLCLIAITLAILMREPSNDADFALPYKKLTTGELKGNTLSINNFRDFRYDDAGNPTELNYLNKDFELNRLKRTWLGISHFAPHGLAHIFLSFEFEADSDAQSKTKNTANYATDYLVVSIEARLTREQISYHPVKGTLRQYYKTVLFTSEKDVIGLRTHHRDERVLLYPIKLSQVQTTSLLLNFVRMANGLSFMPDFYNTLTDNCLTGLMAQSYYFDRIPYSFDYRVLLPGYSDGLAYELGIIDTSLLKETSFNLNQFRDIATINPQGIPLEADNFSSLIRQGWQMKPLQNFPKPPH